jgi:hypothetical protein
MELRVAILFNSSRSQQREPTDQSAYEIYNSYSRWE